MRRGVFNILPLARQSLRWGTGSVGALATSAAGISRGTKNTTATSTTAAAAAAAEGTHPIRRRSPVSQSGTGGRGSTEATSESAAAEATIGIKLGADDELARAFNRFSSSVGGCTDEEFLKGATQAYYSTAAFAGLLAEHAKPIPGAPKLESIKAAAAAAEVHKLIDSELRLATESTKPSTKARDGEDSGAHDESDLLQRVVTAMTSLLPMSSHLATSMFQTWCMQKEKRANLFGIAGPSDYVMDSKLVVFARLDNTKIYIADPATFSAKFEVVFAAEYLQQRQRFTRDDADGAMHEETILFTSDGRATVRPHSQPGETEGASRSDAQSAGAAGTGADRRTSSVADGQSTATGVGSHRGGVVSGKHARVVVTTEDGETAARATTESVHAHKVGPGQTVTPVGVAEARAGGGASEDAGAGVMDALYVRVNGATLPPIPSTAQACALLTMDVVVPPERYASNFEWYYNRIVGYESEYERIAAARVFAQTTPKSVANTFDFITRMFTGKPVEFMFTKAIGKMIGLPDNVSECPPATRKLVCMYMDPAKRWILADLVPLAPITSTKLPQAN